MKETIILLFLLALLTVHLKASKKQTKTENDEGDIDMLIKRLENTLEAQIRNQKTTSGEEEENIGRTRRKKLRKKFWHPGDGFGTRVKDHPTFPPGKR